MKKKRASWLMAVAGVYLWLALAASAGWAAPNAADHTLIMAARRGDVSGVQQALAHGANVNAKTQEDWTALMAASFAANRAAVVRLLLARGADVQARNGRGLTSLMYASGAGSEPVVRLLLTHGADVAVQDTDDGTTALMFAASAPITRLLLARGAAVETRDRTGWTALCHMAAPDNLASARLLLEHGARANAADGGMAPLMAASTPRMMRLLIAHGARVEARDRAGWTALLWAAKRGDETAAIRFLLAHGARLNATRAGRSALYYAVEIYDGTATVRLLLDHGARVNMTNGSGWTPLNNAIQHGNVPAVRLLLEHGARVNAGWDAQGGTPLINSLYSSEEGAEIRKLLLKYGADVNQADRAGQTPLMAAIEQKDTAMMEALLRRGARVNAHDQEGQTALMRAAEGNNRLPLVKLLLKHGAAIDAADRKGRTALMNIASHRYSYEGDTETAEFLLRRGASLTKKDKLGLSALALFQQNAAENPDFAALLRRRHLPGTPAWEPHAFL